MANRVRNGRSNQRKLLETDKKFRVSITNGEGLQVLAPLPDNFGLTVGSEYTAPFDAHFVGGTLAKAAVVTGVGTKLGVSTSKFYSAPEPSEISFDVQFEAYYDAGDEVIAPIIKLMVMALGRTITLEDGINTIEEILSRVSSSVGQAVGGFLEEIIPENTEETADRIFDFLGFVKSPPMCKIKFGEALRLEKVYISSVSPQFSNILDYRGYPMSATCSITAVLERDPILDQYGTFDNMWVGGLSG